MQLFGWRSARWLCLVLVGAQYQITLCNRGLPSVGASKAKLPVHVTRLHRYEHSGLAALLEAEQDWHSGATMQQPTHDFPVISGRQASALRRHHEEMQSFVQLSETASVVSEHHREEVKPSLRSRRRSVEHPVTALKDLGSQYLGPLSVGTKIQPQGCSQTNANVPSSLIFISDVDDNQDSLQHCHMEAERQLMVVYDSGSTNLWVASDLCDKGPCVNEGRHRYNHSESISYVKPGEGSTNWLSIKFGTGEVAGPQAVEDFHVGPFTIKGQTFHLIQVEHGSVWEEVALEGILGLGFPSLSAGGAVSFVDNLIHQQDVHEFAFYLSRGQASNALFWGGVDPEFTEGSTTFFDIVDPHYWSMELLSFRLGEEELLAPGKHAGTRAEGANPVSASPKLIVDTGTTFFTAETGLYEEIMRRLPAARCSNLTSQSYPDLVYRLRISKHSDDKAHAGQPFDIHVGHKQYMVASGRDDDAQCSPAFMRIDVPKEHGPAMILGEVFFRDAYIPIFRRGDGKPESAQLGLVKARTGPDVTAHLKAKTEKQVSFHQRYAAKAA